MEVGKELPPLLTVAMLRTGIETETERRTETETETERRTETEIGTKVQQGTLLARIQFILMQMPTLKPMLLMLLMLMQMLMAP
jgi:hypothetical protein